MISKNWVISKLVTEFPKGVKFGVNYLPKGVYLTPIEQILNRFFRAELQRCDLDFIEAKPVRVEVSDLGLEFTVMLQQQRLRVCPGTEGHAVSLRGTSQHLFLLSTQRVDPDTLFFRRLLSIQGNTEAALELKNLLDTIELENRLPKFLHGMTETIADTLEQNLHQVS